MLYQVMRHIRNFFPGKTQEGDFKIENQSIDLSAFVLSGQYILIEGSALNDGVYLYDDSMTLLDESFNGRITALNVPKDFLATVKDMEEYVATGKDNSPYTSESFGGYSYTRATNASGDLATVFDVFRARLNAWRKV